MTRPGLSSIVASLFAATTLALAGCADAPAPRHDATSIPQASGLDLQKSPYDADETVQRFENVARNHGLHIFDVIDHAAGAREAGMTLAPTQLVIFGNPKAGTPLMQCNRTIAIDLPSKALVWRDHTGQTWLGINDIRYLARRHHMKACPGLAKVDAMLRTLANQTVAGPTSE